MTGSRHNNRGRGVPSCEGVKDASITPNRTASGTGTATTTTGSATTGDRGKHTVHWFRKGLRLHDNPSLREGLNGANTFRCVFVIDPWSAGSKSIGINKWRFSPFYFLLTILSLMKDTTDYFCTDFSFSAWKISTPRSGN